MKLVFATNNQHKLQELRQIAGDKFEILSLGDIYCHQEIPETGVTLEENALQKARFIHDRYGVDCFADDTGLEVCALDGAPGVYSARYAARANGKEHCTSQENVELLLKEMSGKADRRACFRTVIALILDGKEYVFHGIVDGEIIEERHGEGGFGYDPVFRPDGWDCTFAEAAPEAKNAISHRGRASAALIAFLKNNL